MQPLRQASPIEGSCIFFVRVSRPALHEVGLTTHKPYVLADDDKMRIFSTSDLANKETGISRETLRLTVTKNYRVSTNHHLQFSAGLNSKRSSFGSSNLGRKMTEEVVEMNRIRVESLVLEVTNPVVCQHTMVDMTFTYSWFFCST